GTTLLGGVSDCGTVFRVTADGSSYAVLRSFDCVEAGYPLAGLVEGPDGQLYGTTSSGGPSNDGTVFRISKDGLAFEILHAFDGTDGSYPVASLIVGAEGTFYGTTLGLAGVPWGPPCEPGSVFKMLGDGSGFAVLRTFDFGCPFYFESGPAAALVQGPDGSLYGSTVAGPSGWPGTLFKLSPDGKAFELLHNFTDF